MVCASNRSGTESPARRGPHAFPLRDPAFFENEDSIRAFDCGEAMGDDDRCRTPRQVVECFGQLTFRYGV